MNDDLFTSPELEPQHAGSDPGPLAARMRPRTLEEVAGQEHILAPGCMLRRVIEADRLPSMVFYGPPGCGKTTLAEVIARTTRRRFVRVSGVNSNVAELRNLCEEARILGRNRGTILFIDEIHRFNRGQQDVLLPYVEDGTVVLIGATTHHPRMFITSALTSRSLVFELKSLSVDAARILIRRALSDNEHGLGLHNIPVDDDAVDFLANICEGDGRHALTALELAVRSQAVEGGGRVTLDVMQECVQRRAVRYDRDEEGHYDTISAFIKSIRGTDPDAALYWLVKMLEGGEDPRFIARRLIILASEDIGNADPRALTLAVSAMDAVQFIGMPEGRIVLAQATTYLATAPKSNASYTALDAAQADLASGRVLDVPEHLKNLHVDGVGSAKNDGYKYPHNHPGAWVEQAYLPERRRYYKPTEEGYEATIKRRLEVLQNAKKQPPRT